LTTNDKKRWYLTGVGAAAVSAAASCCLDHVGNFDVYDRLFEPLVILLLIACIWMLVACILWSCSKDRPSIVGFVLLNLTSPLLVGGLVTFEPNVHGAYALLILFELFSILTVIGMIIGTLFTRLKKDA
jgi:hypothetical protein